MFHNLKKQKLFLWAWGLLFLSLTACSGTQTEPDPGTSFNPRVFNLYIVDKDTGKSLIGTAGQPYHPDSIDVSILSNSTDIDVESLDTDQNGEYFIRNIAISGFGPVKDYIRYSVYLNQETIDTLMVSNPNFAGILEFHYNQQLISTFNFAENHFDTDPVVRAKK